MARFQLGKRIGGGGQGEVFRATAPTGDIVALKRFKMPPDASSSELEAYRTRFRREIEVTSHLTHRNILEILADNSRAEVPWYVMDLADESLEDVIRTAAPKALPLGTAIDLYIQVCEGMAHAHERGVLHRDLKPSNILMFSGVPRIADFGLGRELHSGISTLTQSRMGWGSMHYMAPEQMTALHNAAKPADVYALGVILFQMLTGKPPHLCKIEGDSVPEDFRYIVTRCLRDSVRERFEDAGQLLEYVRLARSADATVNAPPKQRAEAATSDFMSGDSDALHRLAQIFETHPSDSQLYRIFLPKLSKKVLRELPHLTAILKHYDRAYAWPNATFEYADVVADFYSKVIPIIQSAGLKSNLLQTFLQQAYGNNRYYAAEQFAELCSTMYSTPVYRDIIRDVLAENPASHDFIRPYLLKYSLPTSIAAVFDQPDRRPASAASFPSRESVADEDPFADTSDDPWNASEPWDERSGSSADW